MKPWNGISSIKGMISNRLSFCLHFFLLIVLKLLLARQFVVSDDEYEMMVSHSSDENYKLAVLFNLISLTGETLGLY